MTNAIDRERMLKSRLIEALEEREVAIEEIQIASKRLLKAQDQVTRIQKDLGVKS